MSDTMTRLPIKMASAYSGLTLSDAIQKALADSTQGGAGTAAFFARKTEMTDFIDYILQHENWNVYESKSQPGVPVYTVQQGSHFAEIRLTLDDAVYQEFVDPAATADSAALHTTGSGLQRIGQATVTLNNQDNDKLVETFSIKIPELLGDITGMAMFLKGLKGKLERIQFLRNLLGPVVRKIKDGVMSLWRGVKSLAGISEVAPAAAGAAEAATEEVMVSGEETLILGISCDTLVFIGGAIILAVIFVANRFLLHDSSQSMTLVNYTPFDLTWNIVNQRHGSCSMYPVDSKSDMKQLVPGIRVEPPPDPDLIPEPTVFTGDFQFTNDNKFEGIRYVVAIEFQGSARSGGESPVALPPIGCLFDVPWAGDNSLYCNFDPGHDWDKWSQNFAGQYKQLSYQQVFENTYGLKDYKLVTCLSFDFLNEKAKGSGDKEAYYYTSTLICYWLKVDQPIPGQA